jgi:hypothetical protein
MSDATARTWWLPTSEPMIRTLERGECVSKRTIVDTRTTHAPLDDDIADRDLDGSLMRDCLVLSCVCMAVIRVVCGYGWQGQGHHSALAADTLQSVLVGLLGRRNHEDSI